MPQTVWKGAVSVAFVRPSVCRSVAYIANNSRNQRPSMPKFGRRVPDLRCDSHTSFKLKRSKVRRAGAYRVGRTRRSHCLLSLALNCEVDCNDFPESSRIFHNTLHLSVKCSFAKGRLNSIEMRTTFVSSIIVMDEALLRKIHREDVRQRRCVVYALRASTAYK